jgi:hypothetical protein
VGRVRAALCMAAVVMALLVSAGQAEPASAALPAYCHLDAGKIALATSTTTRSVNARWPGFTCTTPGPMGYDAKLFVWNGASWQYLSNPYANGSKTAVTSFPGHSITVSCPHQALVRISVAYRFYLSHTSYKQIYWTNSAICS